MNEQEFLKEVEKEVILLKKHASKEQLDNLDADLIDPTHADACIYGQMTGECRSLEAKRLMDLCCKRIFLVDDGAEDLTGKKFSKVKGFLGEKYTGQTWDEASIEVGDKYCIREFMYLSVLEGYICLKGAKVKSVISFLKGKVNKLSL
ncbi:MAG: hypothetical protein AABY15_02705 [Nanoarchaeota archaeon]